METREEKNKNIITHSKQSSTEGKNTVKSTSEMIKNLKNKEKK